MKQYSVWNNTFLSNNGGFI